MKILFCTMFGKLLQPGVIFKLKMHKKRLTTAWTCMRAYSAPIDNLIAGFKGAAPQQGRDNKEWMKRGGGIIPPITNSWIRHWKASHNMEKQEGLAVASIVRDDPSTLTGDDPFPRAH